MKENLAQGPCFADEGSSTVTVMQMQIGVLAWDKKTSFMSEPVN